MPQRARSAQALQQRPRHAGQGLSFLLFRAEAGREAAREPLCGLPPPPPRPPRTSRPVGSPLRAARLLPSRHRRPTPAGPVVRVLAGPSPQMSSVHRHPLALTDIAARRRCLCGPPAPHSSHHHSTSRSTCHWLCGARGSGVAACSLRTRPRLSHLVLPVLGEKGLQRAQGRGAMERSSTRTARRPHAPKLRLPSLTSPLPTPPAFRGPHTQPQASSSETAQA